MRIYDLHKEMDALVSNTTWQIELIGELGAWTYKVSRRERGGFWVGVGTTPYFLDAYDQIVELITSNQ